MPTVSIIVPIYNSEKTISRCIDSILTQTYKDFELLLINDGSTDNSGRICAEYASRDGRIKAIDKQNSGVSDTRNLGLSMANGRYIQFLDSDDWISPDSVGLFVHAITANDCDMVIADFYRVVGDRVSKKGAIEKDGLLDKTDYAEKMLQNPADYYYGVLWNKFFKADIIKKHGLKMDSRISWSEDFIFCLEYIRNISSIYVLKVPVYYYVKTKGSLVTKSVSVSRTIQMKRTVFEYYSRFYKDTFGAVSYEKLKGQVYRFLIDTAGDGIVLPAVLPGIYKLGDERTNIGSGLLNAEGFLFDQYRERKLHEMLLDSVALKNNMSLNEIRTLFVLSLHHEKCTAKDLSDAMGIGRASLTIAIQSLISKGYITEKGKTKYKDYETTEKAEPIISETRLVLEDCRRLKFEGFTDEEIDIYLRLNNKKNENIKKILG